VNFDDEVLGLVVKVHWQKGECPPRTLPFLLEVVLVKYSAWIKSSLEAVLKFPDGF